MCGTFSKNYALRKIDWFLRYKSKIYQCYTFQEDIQLSKHCFVKEQCVAFVLSATVFSPLTATMMKHSTGPINRTSKCGPIGVSL